MCSRLVPLLSSEDYFKPDDIRFNGWVATSLGIDMCRLWSAKRVDTVVIGPVDAVVSTGV